MSSLSSTLGLTSADPKTAVMEQVRQAAAMQNAKALIEKLNEHCFEKCIPTPGSSLSKGEQSCFTQCMEKYMNGWNVVSQQYVERIRSHQS